MIPPLWKKLNFKENFSVCVLNEPKDFDKHLPDIAAFSKVNKEIDLCSQPDLLLIFVYKKEDIANFCKLIESNLKDEVVLWFAYPKKSSKKYKSDISRDEGWEPVGSLKFEAVRQIAIDQDWSALRFRHISQIKEMKRDEKRRLTSN